MSLLDDIKFGLFGTVPRKKSTLTRTQDYIIRDEANQAMKTLDSATASREEKQKAMEYIEYANKSGVKI